MRKKAFTLVEMLVVVIVLWLVFTIVIDSYFKLIKTKTDIYIRTVLAKNTNDLVEKLNLTMKNYTIDYEEYFNRKQTWCDGAWWASFSWDVWTNWYCDKFTAYWNGNNGIDPSVNVNTWLNVIYYCSSKSDAQSLKEEVWGIKDCEWSSSDGVTGSNYIYNYDKVKNGSGCAQNGIQSFWEYKAQFWDLKWNVDGKWWCKDDDDDTDLWKGPVAIKDNTHVKELYLISKDGKKRLFLRRKLVFSGDLNHDGVVDDWEKLYKIQILKLRWFDAWSWHIFTWSFAYDGKIDTWACDKSEWFICKWDPIWWWYVWYKLPEDENDWWKDLTITDLTIEDLNFVIYPTKSPNLSWQDVAYQINPYIWMKLKTWFYGINYMRKINPAALSGYKMNINTVFSIKPY